MWCGIWHPAITSPATSVICLLTVFCPPECRSACHFAIPQGTYSNKRSAYRLSYHPKFSVMLQAPKSRRRNSGPVNRRKKCFDNFWRYEEDKSIGGKRCKNKQIKNRPKIESKNEELVQMTDEGIEHDFAMDSGTMVPLAVFSYHYERKPKAQK